MKKSKAILLGLLFVFLILGSSRLLAVKMRNLPKPKLSIYEALRIAEDQMAIQKVDVSKYFILSAILHISGDPSNVAPKEYFKDEDTWVVTWEPFVASDHQNHYVIVYMDKSVKIISTK